MTDLFNADLLDADLLRGVIAVEMLTLAALAVFRQTVDGANDTRARQRWSTAQTSVLLIVVAGVVLNMIAPVPISPGVIVVAAGSLPAVVYGVVVTGRTVRAHRAYLRLTAHLAHAEPCGNPDCVSARAELARIRDDH